LLLNSVEKLCVDLVNYFNKHPIIWMSTNWNLDVG